MKPSHTIIFAHLGPQIPPWLMAALMQARTFNSCPIAIIAASSALSSANIPKSLNITPYTLEDIGVSEKNEIFLEISPLDRAFRGGFWTYTTERFFVIEAAMEKYSIENAVHLENDVLLYCDLEHIVPKLSRLYRGIAATFDNDERCIPGFMFVPGVAAIAGLTEYILSALQSPTIVNAKTLVNDMSILGKYRLQGAAAIDHLPIIPPDYPAALRSTAGHTTTDANRYSQHFSTLETIFDAAALGQYLGGIDTRNDARPSAGFINESCLFDPRLLNVRMTNDARGLRIPVVETASGIHAVANLHIHSKNPGPFLSIPAGTAAPF